MGSGGAGMAPDIEAALSRSPQLADALGVAGSRIPSIPPKLGGIMDVQDLMQEALMGIMGSPDPAKHPEVAQKAMQAFMSRMMQSPEQRGIRVGMGAQGGVGTVTAPPPTEGMLGELFQSPAAGKRAGVTPQAAQQAKATLSPREQAAIERVMAETAGPQHQGLVGQIQKKLGTATPNPIKAKAKGKGPKTEVPSEDQPGPVRGMADMSPEELDRILAAYEQLFPKSPPR